MKKQLITDQLIEEYQKQIIKTEKLIETIKGNKSLPMSLNALEAIKNSCEVFIKSLQSLRQQEQQNVIDAVYDTSIKYAEEKGFEDYLKSKANEYFTQTFEQKGGEKK